MARLESRIRALEQVSALKDAPTVIVGFGSWCSVGRHQLEPGRLLAYGATQRHRGESEDALLARAIAEQGSGGNPRVLIEEREHAVCAAHASESCI